MDQGRAGGGPDLTGAAPKPELSVVVPVYNEGERVVPVLRALCKALATPHEVLVVHDFDDDTTVPPVRALAAELPTVRLVRNDLGRGVLNAMKAGIAASRGKHVLVTMADGSDDARDVEPMLRFGHLGADVVAASRYMRGGRQQGGPRLKRLLSRIAGLSLHAFAGVPIHDPTNNFKLYSREFLDSVTIESQAGFELAIELSVKAALAGRMMAEVPTTWRDRTAGQSRFQLRAWLPHYLRWYLLAFRGRLAQVFRRRPPRP
jgi:glycosyltransferase involved in cell wall biosynthesis